MKTNYIVVMFADETFAKIAKDGLLYEFDEKYAEFLNKYTSGNDVWYFNETKDRECAERIGNKIYINPSIVAREKGLPVLWENNI